MGHRIDKQRLAGLSTKAVPMKLTILPDLSPAGLIKSWILRILDPVGSINIALTSPKPCYTPQNKKEKGVSITTCYKQGQFLKKRGDEKQEQGIYGLDDMTKLICENISSPS